MTLRLSGLPFVAAREQLNGDPYGSGVAVGKAIHERYPHLVPEQVAEIIGVRVCEYSRHGRTITRVWRSGGGSLFYSRAGRRFLIEYESGLVGVDKQRVVALSLGVSFVALRSDGGVRAGVREERFAQGFADGMLGQSYYEAREIDDARIRSAVVRSRVKDVLFGDGEGASRAGEGGAAGSGRLVTGGPIVGGAVGASSVGSGKSVALVDSAPTRNQFARPDMVLSLNGRNVEVYNPDGVPLSTIVDGRGVSLVNEATGERVCVPKSASRVFFVDGDVWYQRPDDGDPDLVFDNGWTARMLSSTVCYDCGAPVDVDGDRCDACEGLRQLMFLSLLAI